MNQLQALRDTIRLAEDHGMPDLPGSDLGLAHLRRMVDAAESRSFSPSKLGRWLGWAQCAVVAANVGVTLADMKPLNEHMDEKPWWHGREDNIDFFALDWEPDSLTCVAELLETPFGAVPASIEPWFRGGLGLLVTYLRNLKIPCRDVLAARRDEFLDRPRPFLPRNSTLIRSVDNNEQVAWIDPRRIFRAAPTMYVARAAPRNGNALYPSYFRTLCTNEFT